MSRLAKWTLEKTKVKVVFRLQFHATHIPQTGWDKLFISFIPVESGRATAKTTKANVRNGICKWGDPIYETTRLLQDAKTKKFDEKLYKLVVMMGTSRSSILGEAIINLADFAEALKPAAVALPLHGCDSGTTLNVTVQLLTSKTGFREFEQQRELTEKGVQRVTNQISHDNGTGKGPLSKEMQNNQTDKVNAKVRFKSLLKETDTFEEIGVSEYADLAAGCDASSNTSESLHAERHDMLSSHEVDSIRSTVSADLGGHSSSQSPQLLKGDSSELLRQASSEWVHGWNSDYSLDNELVIANEENSRLRGSLEVADCDYIQIKSDVLLLQNYANELCSDTQKFANQLASEFASGQESRKEVFMLKSECSQLKYDLEQLKAIKFSPLSGRHTSDRDQQFENLKPGWLEGLLFIENKVRELQTKTSTGFQEGNFIFLGPDLELILSALQDLRQINEPESGFQSSPGADSLDMNSALRDKIFELLRDLNESKAEGESLMRKMDQMECYYETLIHELEENQKLMVAELHNVRTEHSTCVYTLSLTKTQMETMHQDFSEQIARYVEDRRELDELNKELEKRLISSEAALKRARLNYSIAVDQLQKDLELLSLQIISMHHTNENLIKQAFPKPLEQCFLDDTETRQDLRAPGAVQHLHRQIHKQQVGRDMVSEDLKTSLQLQKQLFQKVEAEICEMQQTNLELDVFGIALRESLLEANCRVLCMNDAADKLTQQFVSAINSKELLMRRLRGTEEDLQVLNDFKNSCISTCEKLNLQNQNLEANLEALADENHLLSQKLQVSESLVMELGVYKGNYETCDEERRDLEELLRQKSIANDSLANKVSTVQEKLRLSETECLELASQNADMSDTINFLADKLRCMLQSYCQIFHDQALSLPFEHPDEKLDAMDFRMVVAQLELSQNEACGKLLKLIDESEKLTKKQVSVVASLNRKNSEISDLKTKLRSVLLDTHHCLEKSDAAVQKLQLELEAFAERVQLTCKSEITDALLGDEIVQALSHLEVQMKDIASRHNDFVCEILALENVAEEHGRGERVLSELKQENQLIRAKLHESTIQSRELKAEIDILKENVTALQKELHIERCHNNKLESKVTELTQKLKETSNRLNCLEQKLQELESKAERLAISFEFEEKLSQLEDEIVNGFSVLESQLKDVTMENKDLVIGISALQTTNQELGSSKLTINELTQKNEVLGKSLKEKVDMLAQLQAEMVNLQDTLECLSHELDRERDSKTNLEIVVADLAQENKTLLMALQKRDSECLKLESEISSLTKRLEAIAIEFNCTRDLKKKFERRAEELTCELNKKNEQLLDFDQQKDALAQFSEQMLNLEAENSSLTLLLLNHEERQLTGEKLSSLTGLEIDELLGLLLEENVKLSFLQTQYEGIFLDLVKQIKSSYGQNEALRIKCSHLDTKLDECLSREVNFIEDNGRLTSSLESLKYALEASVAQNHILLDNVESLEFRSVRDKNQHTEELSSSSGGSDNQTDSLLLFSQMLSIQVLVLKAKLHEILPQLTLLGSYKQEVMKLKVHCTDLTQRLSAEIMKAEEFKSLSVHFKELKDRAEAQCAQASEKNELEGPTMVRQDSLRVAFIKEQCESEIQELKHQLSVSKKHSDEMLWKLQDAINETESRKKSEASYMKKINELSTIISQIETELERAVSEKREKIMDIDRMQAELECSLISLDCCREEKQKVETLLVQCQAELGKSETELASVREQLKHFTDRYNQLKEAGDCTRVANELVAVSGNHRGTNAENAIGESIICKMQPQSLNQGELKSLPDEDKDSEVITHAQEQMQPFVDQDIVLDNGVKNYDVIRPKFKTENLRSSLEHLQNELEKMKRENSDSQVVGTCELSSVDLQREMMQLDKANEELGSRYAYYKEFSCNGDALQRVLALELELAEALQAKKKSSFSFQSSFLKMHSDEDAIYRSFRDINELIKDMLEIKGRYNSVENELKEMHDRYSELSLQFAEVEGERQKLTIMLKNVRSPRRNLISNTSGSPIFTDNSSQAPRRESFC